MPDKRPAGASACAPVQRKKQRRANVGRGMRIAYLCNRYPAVSMTFVRREVAALRQLGVAVDTFSIRRALPGDLLAPVDREAARETYAVLPPKPLDLLGAHARALATRPLAYVRTLTLSLRLGSGGARATLWRLFYFVEAIVVWNRCRRDGIRHLHAHFANVATDVALLCASFGDHPRSSSAGSLVVELHLARAGRVLRRAPRAARAEDRARSLRRLHQRLRAQPGDGLLGAVAVAQAARRPLWRRSRPLASARRMLAGRAAVVRRTARAVRRTADLAEGPGGADRSARAAARGGAKADGDAGRGRRRTRLAV